MDLKFNKLFIIESLDGNKETLTGEKLRDDISAYRFMNPRESEIILRQVKTKEELKDELNKILEETRNGIIPAIHFEMHGADTGGIKEINGTRYYNAEKLMKGGLVTWQDNKLTSWEELMTMLREINIACGNNLLVTMAVCFGIWNITYAYLHEAAPFFITVGAFDEMYNNQIEICYQAFYETLLQADDIDKATDALNKENAAGIKSGKDWRDIRRFDCFDVYTKIYKNYLRKQVYDSDGLDKRAETIFQTFLMEDQEQILKYKDNKEIIKIKIKEDVLNTAQELYDEHRKKFLMIDSFPDYAQRFPMPESVEEFYKQ